MSTRSSLTVVSGTTITSAWGNGIRDHIVARTTSNDATADGQLCLNTSTERLVYYNGSSVFPLAGAIPGNQCYEPARPPDKGSPLIPEADRRFPASRRPLITNS